MSPTIVVIAVLWIMFAAALARVVIPLNGMALRSRDAMWAPLYGALALTMGWDELYRVIDRLTGAINLANLAKYTALMLCAFYLSKAVIALSFSLTPVLRRKLRVALVTALIVHTGAFVMIDARPTATAFVETFANHPLTLVYSITHFLFFAIAECIAVVVVVRERRRQPRPLAQTVSLSALALGGVAAVATVAVTIVRDTARFTGAVGTAELMDGPYKALLLLIAIGNCIGLGAPALVGVVRRIRIRQDVSTLSRAAGRLECPPLLAGLSNGSGDDELWPLREAALRLRDSEVGGRPLPLTDHEHVALARTEARLLVGVTGSFASTTHPAICVIASPLALEVLAVLLRHPASHDHVARTIGAAPIDVMELCNRLAKLSVIEETTGGLLLTSMDRIRKLMPYSGSST